MIEGKADAARPRRRGDRVMRRRKFITTSFAEAAAREFSSSALEDVPASPDLEWLRACVGYLARRDA